MDGGCGYVEEFGFEYDVLVKVFLDGFGGGFVVGFLGVWVGVLDCFLFVLVSDFLDVLVELF